MFVSWVCILHCWHLFLIVYGSLFQFTWYKFLLLLFHACSSFCPWSLFRFILCVVSLWLPFGLKIEFIFVLQSLLCYVVLCYLCCVSFAFLVLLYFLLYYFSSLTVWWRVFLFCSFSLSSMFVFYLQFTFVSLSSDTSVFILVVFCLLYFLCSLISLVTLFLISSHLYPLPS